jgi:transcriptional regulator with XRE-family HTH domain
MAQWYGVWLLACLQIAGTARTDSLEPTNDSNCLSGSQECWPGLSTFDINATALESTGKRVANKNSCLYLLAWCYPAGVILLISFGASLTKRKAEALRPAPKVIYKALRKAVIDMTFGERLRQLRKAAGESQTDLAIILGKPAASTVSGYETGYREPNFEAIRTICEHYKVSADFLLGINESEKASKIAKNGITVNVEISTLLDGNPVELEYIRQAIKEKIERDAGEKDVD